MKTKERISRTSIQESLQQKKVLPEMTSDVKIRRDFKVELVAQNHCFFKKTGYSRPLILFTFLNSYQ